ncbi:hypothetical protein [Streptomyces sp. S1]|uniref:hypothetical protein n=1 Tax=Streptomyces sp. S1 TaxID=718288 RepID=UPI003D7266F8
MSCGVKVKIDGEFTECVIDGDEHDGFDEHVACLDIDRPGFWLVWNGVSTDGSRVEERPVCSKGSGPEDDVATDWCYGPQDHPGRCTWEVEHRSSA